MSEREAALSALRQQAKLLIGENGSFTCVPLNPNTLLELLDERERLIRLGNKLADAAERLEQNPLANCLPRFRYPVQDAVAEWRDV